MNDCRSSLRLLATFIAFLVALRVAAQDPASLQTELDACVRDHKLAGVSVAVGKGDALWWSSGAGYADVEKQTPMTAATVHRIASISKPIAAVGAMLLVQDGKLRLEDTVRPLVSAWPEAYAPITVYQLLTHTSGIRHYKNLESMSNVHYNTLVDAFAAFKDDAIIAAPGEKYIYSTYGYTVLGAMVEAASGEGLHDLLKRRVWEPAGMTATTFEFAGVPVENCAVGYSLRRKGKLVPSRPTDLSVKYPGGGMLSTAEDLVRFGMAFDAGQLVSIESKAKMLEPAKLSNGSTNDYGLGWNVGKNPKHPGAYAHSGGQAGTSTKLSIYPDAKLVIAIICNVEEAFEAVNSFNGALLDKLTAQP
jgi:serine beta-lactamase-like protein LACTB